MDKFKKINVINSNKENIFLILNDQGNRENNESKKIKALTYISLVKIISVFLVILKHTNENYWVFNQYWISTNIMASFCMCAVPLFSLCIGATLLDFNERYNIKIYWKRRIKKVVLPILGWNIIYYFYRVYILKNFQKINFDFINLYKLYFNNQLYPIILSLRIFIFGYMIIPLIAYVDKINKIKVYSYCFLTLLINQSIIPYLINFNKVEIISWPYNYNLGYAIYIFAGYIIQNYEFNKMFKIFIYISGIIGLLLRLIIAHYLTLKYRKVDKSQINYLNLPIVLYSCAAFLFTKEHCIHLFKIINNKFIIKLGSLTMGPFFLHYICIWTYFSLINTPEYTFNYRFFGAIIITIICFITTAIIKKIPLLRNLAP